VVAIAVAVVAAVPLDCQRTRLTPPRQIDTHSEFKPALPRKWVALTSFAKKKIKFIKLHLKVIRNISCACQRKKKWAQLQLDFLSDFTQNAISPTCLNLFKSHLLLCI